nr:MAG TPA: hypothetical protein [Caudoviricetes sp.]
MPSVHLLSPPTYNLYCNILLFCYTKNKCSRMGEQHD